MRKSILTIALLAVAAFMFTGCPVGTGAFYAPSQGRDAGINSTMAQVRIYNDTTTTTFFSWYDEVGQVGSTTPLEVPPGGEKTTTVRAERTITYKLYTEGNEASPMHSAKAELKAQWTYKLDVGSVASGY